MTPVPLTNVPVRLVDSPSVTEVGFAVKLVIEAATGFTVTIAVWLTETPAEFVTVRVYAVVSDGLTLIAVPLVTARFPGVMMPVPLAKTPVKLADPPAVIDVGFAVKLVIAGAAGITGGTVTTAVWVTITPDAFVTVRV
jgi:hypothetical protein